MTTRKQALQRAIEHLSRFPEYAEEVRLLEEICDELPLIHWSDRSIRDTVEQFILDNGRPPTASDFKKAGMPPHTVIQSKYKMPLSRWLDETIPHPNCPLKNGKRNTQERFGRITAASDPGASMSLISANGRRPGAGRRLPPIITPAPGASCWKSLTCRCTLTGNGILSLPISR